MSAAEELRAIIQVKDFVFAKLFFFSSYIYFYLAFYLVLSHILSELLFSQIF